VHVLRRLREALVPEGIVLDLQVIRPHPLVEVDGAQHGFAVHDDPNYLDPQTQVWQASVVRSVTEWVVGHA